MATNEELLSQLGYDDWNIALQAKLDEIGPNLSTSAEKEWQETWGDDKNQKPEDKYYFMNNWLSNYKEGSVRSDGSIEEASQDVAVEKGNKDNGNDDNLTEGHESDSNNQTSSIDRGGESVAVDETSKDKVSENPYYEFNKNIYNQFSFMYNQSDDENKKVSNEEDEGDIG